MKTDTIVRTVLLALSLLNLLFAKFGLPQLEIENDTIYQAVTYIAAIVTAIWSWWKNNSITKEAQYADDVLKEMKAKKQND